MGQTGYGIMAKDCQVLFWVTRPSSALGFRWSAHVKTKLGGKVTKDRIVGGGDPAGV